MKSCKFTTNKLNYFILLLFYTSICIASDKFKTLDDKVEYYKNRYGSKCLDEKITDNFGNGYDALYGTRNMRTILYGIAYRGGANNFYNKTKKRDNHNPLPEEGLYNLANEGFSTAVYLYSGNFESAKHLIINSKTKDSLNYLNLTGSNKKTLRKIVEIVSDVINKPAKGPIYFHCWNGWHQSGLISSVILMQFCKFSNKQALQYWIDNTDGVNKGFENVKSFIRNYKPFNDLNIDSKTQAEICPCQNK